MSGVCNRDGDPNSAREQRWARGGPGLMTAVTADGTVVQLLLFFSLLFKNIQSLKKEKINNQPTSLSS